MDELPSAAVLRDHRLGNTFSLVPHEVAGSISMWFHKHSATVLEYNNRSNRSSRWDGGGGIGGTGGTGADTGDSPMLPASGVERRPCRPSSDFNNNDDAMNDDNENGQNEHFQNLGNGNGSAAEPHPMSDKGRTRLLNELLQYGLVSFENWAPEEVLMFCVVAFPREEFLEATKNARQPLFFQRVFQEWHPRICDWFLLLWMYVGEACEFFADALFVLPKDQQPSPELAARELFRWMLDDGVYSEWTCMSIASALIPYAKAPSCARSHADTILKYAKYLPPYNLGLVVRCLILGLEQPSWCACGYQPGEKFCRCVHPDTIFQQTSQTFRDKRFALDSGRVYACILLQLLIDELQQKKFNPEIRVYTDQMRDDMIRSACEYVFSEHSYITIYKSVVYRSEAVQDGLEKEPPKLRNPRKPLGACDAFGDFRNQKDDYENSAAQTGCCVVANCKQHAKDGCANVSCKTHCADFFFQCRAHRNYPRDRPYKPRKNINLVSRDHGQPRHIIARDNRNI